MALKMGRRAPCVQDTPGGHCEREHLLLSLSIPSLSTPTYVTMVSLLIQETRSRCPILLLVFILAAIVERKCARTF